MKDNQMLFLYIFRMFTFVAYYGLTVRSPQLVNDPYLNFFLLGVTEIPAYIVATVTTK